MGAKLNEAETKRMLFAVDCWLESPPWDISDSLENVEFGEKQFRAKMARIGSIAAKLREEIGGLYPSVWWPNHVDFFGFTATLKVLAEFFAACGVAPERPRGAPRTEWRDELIAVVHAHYPATKITIATGSHFEQTIEILLNYLGVAPDPEVLHKQILRTLKAAPQVPFIVE